MTEDRPGVVEIEVSGPGAPELVVREWLDSQKRGIEARLQELGAGINQAEMQLQQARMEVLRLGGELGLIERQHKFLDSQKRAVDGGHAS